MINTYLPLVIYISLSVIWIYILYNFVSRYKSFAPDNPRVNSLVKAFIVFSIALMIDSIYWTIFNFSMCGVFAKKISIILGNSENVFLIKLILLVAGIYVVLMLWKKKIEELALESKEKKEVERLNIQLSETNEKFLKFANVIRGISECVFIANLEGNITFINNAVSKIIGYGENFFIDKFFLSLFIEKNEKEFEHIFKTVLEQAWEGELQLRTSSGQKLIIFLSASIIKDEQDNPLYIVGIFRDITQKKLWEEQMIQTEKLSAIGQVINGIAHELNNPLTGIIGFAQLLQQSSNCDKEMKEDLQMINKEAMRAKEIVHKLMVFARKQKTQRLMVSINEILKETIKLLTYEIKEGNIKFVEQFETEIPKVMGDYHQFQLVFLNIATNAIQAMGKNGGTITIKTEKILDILKVSITDTGPGIIPENFTRLFDPFFTTKEVGEGTGLGLSVSYGIIKQYKGKIYAESKIGEGSTFFVELPIQEEKFIER